MMNQHMLAGTKAHAAKRTASFRTSSRTSSVGSLAQTPRADDQARGDYTPRQSERVPPIEVETPQHLTSAALFGSTSANPSPNIRRDRQPSQTWSDELVGPWQVFLAVKAVAEQVEVLAGNPDLPAADPVHEVLATAGRLIVLLEKIPENYLVCGRIEEALYLCYEECAEIKVVLGDALSDGIFPRQMLELLRMRAAQLASCTKLLAAHAAIDNKVIEDAAGESDLRRVKLNPACQWFWLKHFPSEATVEYRVVVAALIGDSDFGDLSAAGKRSLLDIAAPKQRGYSMDVVSVADVGPWIMLAALDEFVNNHGLASLTVVGSNPYLTVETEFEITEADVDSLGNVTPGSSLSTLMSELSIRLEAQPSSNLLDLRRQLPTASHEYSFLCHGSAVRVEDESIVHICDVVQSKWHGLAQRNSVVLRAQVSSKDARVPLTSLLEKRMAYFIKPPDECHLQSEFKKQVGVHVIQDIDESDTFTGSSTMFGHVNEVKCVLDVVLVPGLTHEGNRSGDKSRRRFFWEDRNELVESLKEQAKENRLPIRILGVEHRAAGWEVSAWQNQSVGEHLVSAIGVLKRLLAAGVGNRPVIFIAETVGALLVQQMLLLPCSSQSRDVTEDAVPLCEATLAVIDFASPQIGRTESFMRAEDKLRRALDEQELNEKLQAKIPYIAAVQDQFSRACATENGLRGLMQVHVTNAPLDQPHEQLELNHLVILSDYKYVVSIPDRSADSISHPCGDDEEGYGPDAEIIALVTDIVVKSSKIAQQTLEICDENEAESEPETAASPLSRRSLSLSRSMSMHSVGASPRTSRTATSPVSRLRTHRTSTQRTLTRGVSLTGANMDVVRHISVVLRRRTIQALHGVSDDALGLAALPLISAREPYEFLFEALNRLLNQIRKWADMSWRRLIAAFQDPEPSMVIHLFGEDRQVSLAEGWLRHSLFKCARECEAIHKSVANGDYAIASTKQPGTGKHDESSKSFYDLDASFNPLDQMVEDVDRAAGIVADLRADHKWWWEEHASEAGIELGSSYAQTLGLRNEVQGEVANIMKLSSAAVDDNSSDDELNAVEGSSFATATQQAKPHKQSFSWPDLVSNLKLPPTTVTVLGRMGATKTTLIRLLVQDDLLDASEVESTLTSFKICGCSSFEDEELFVEYMSKDDIEEAVRELEKSAEILCHTGNLWQQTRNSSSKEKEPEEALRLRAFASSLVNKHQKLCDEMNILSKSAHPVHKVPLPKRSSRTRWGRREDLAETLQKIKTLTDRDPEHETGEASRSDLIATVTMRLNIAGLQHLSLLDTPGLLHAAGAEESHPRLILRQLATKKALEKTDCWLYLIPWYHKDCLQQLQEDMRCWHPYIPRAEGVVILTRSAEDRDDCDDSSAEPEPEKDVAPETMTTQLFNLRELIRDTPEFRRGAGGLFAISPAVSCLHGALAYTMQELLPDHWDTLDLQPEVEKLARRISGKLGCEYPADAAVPESCLMDNLDKEHWMDAVLEVSGVCTVADRLCAAACAYVAQRSAPQAIALQWEALVQTHTAVSRDAEIVLQSLHAVKLARQMRNEVSTMRRKLHMRRDALFGDIAGTNDLLQSMIKTFNEILQNVLDAEGGAGQVIILERILHQVEQEGKTIKSGRQFEYFKQYDDEVAAWVSKLIAPHILEDQGKGRKVDCLTASSELISKLRAFVDKPEPKDLDELRSEVCKSSEENSEEKSFSEYRRMMKFVADQASQPTRDRQKIADLQEVERELSRGKAVKKEEFKTRLKEVYQARTWAILTKGQLYLWDSFASQLESHLDLRAAEDALLKQVQTEAEQKEDQVTTMERQIREQCGIDTASLGMEELELKLQQKMLQLNQLASHLRSSEQAVLQLASHCINIDVRNWIRDRAQAFGEFKAMLLDPATSEEAATPRSRSSSTNSLQTATESELTQQMSASRWSELEIDFAELQVHRRVGAGASGIVHKGTHRGQDVAIKIFKDQEMMTDEELKEFHDEVAVMANMRCSYIVLLVGVCSVPPNISIITEYMPRGSMYDILHKSAKPLEYMRKLRMILDVIKGMVYLESSRYVHRDLKSQNLLLDRSFRVKVADFGLARYTQLSHVDTANGSAGTPGWMAPEVLRGEQFNIKADVYAFGVVVWETIMQVLPWHGLLNAQIVCAVGLRQERLALDAHEEDGKTPKFDDFMRQLCTDCWQEDPRLRPSFAQLCDRFTAYMTEKVRSG